MTRQFLFGACLFLLSGPLSAQSLTVTDLEGIVLTGAVNYAGTFRRPGIPIYEADFVRRFKVDFGAGGTVKSSVVREVHRNGKVATLNRRFVGVIGQPSANTSKDSQVLWLIDGDTLTALNVFEVGGQKPSSSSHARPRAWRVPSKRPTCGRWAPVLRKSPQRRAARLRSSRSARLGRPVT